MGKFVQEINRRKEWLKNIIFSVKEEINNSPRERLRISKCGNTVQYYINSQDISKERKCGKYLRKKEYVIAEKIAQRDYDIQFLKVADANYKELEKLSGSLYEKLGNVYNEQNEYRKELIKPFVLPDDKYVKKWLSEEYKGLDYNNDSIEIYSIKGERMRSKSEKIIADCLYYNNIPYKYEKPIKLDNITVYPDFTVLNVDQRREIIWEHFGMMDNEEYTKNAVRKIQSYEKAGYFMGDKVIYSFETKMTPIDTRLIEKTIDYYFH